MRNSRYIIIFGLLIFCATVLSAFGSREKNSEAEIPPDKNLLQVTGIVRRTGTSLFPELVITGEDSEWFIIKDEMDKLNDLQHRTVTVEGEEKVTEIVFANGMPAGVRRELSNIKIISINN